MAFQLTDLQSRRLDILAQITGQPLSATGTFPIFTTPSGTYGAPGSFKITCVVAVVLTAPVSISGTLTASLGSTATATDFLASGSITLPVTGTDTIILPPNTSQVASTSGWIQYGTGLVFNFKITAAAGAGSLCNIVVLGFTE